MPRSPTPALAVSRRVERQDAPVAHPTQAQLSSQNTLIMLRSLVMEAAKHRRLVHNKRRDSQPISQITSELGYSSEFVAEEWADLLAQVTHYYQSTPGSPEERFLKAKSKLTPLFIWNDSDVTEKQIFMDPQIALEEILYRHRLRLSQLRPGTWFLAH